MAEKIRVWAFIAGATLFAFAAMAQEESNPCAADREKFCGAVVGGDLHVLKCMIENSGSFSAECRAWMKERGLELAAPGLEAACATEMTAHCKPVIGDPAKMRECLAEHDAALSDDCRAALKRENEKAGKAPDAAPKAEK